MIEHQHHSWNYHKLIQKYIFFWVRAQTIASAKQFEYDGNETGEKCSEGPDGESSCELVKPKHDCQRHAKRIPEELVASKIQCESSNSRIFERFFNA